MKHYIDEAFQLKNWAVLGATQSTHKFGYKIFKMLREKCFNVTPVNPIYDEIDGVSTCPSIAETEGVEVVNVVVSPEKAMAALDEISEKGIEYVWFQPGSYDDHVIQKANDLGLKVIYSYCVLVELGSIPYCPIE